MINTRDSALDLMRGIAIIMMIAFHFIYDLNSFGFSDIPLFTHWAGIAWRCLIVFLFLSAVGISLVIAHGKGIKFKKFLKRLLYLGIAALFVSAGTYVMFPDGWVYFGILHLIWFSTIIAISFVNLPKTSLLIAALILIGAIFDQPNLSFISYLLEPYLPLGSVDYYPLFPWLSFVFIGIYLGHNPYYQKIFIFRLNWLEAIGKHALIIYLTHQIVLFSVVSLAYNLLN
ncbi:heparan-alpha-glucosaminide N-acetyltransferase [Candidatus Pseudothioglobus sp. Uisw_050_01]|uniref:heparan-alpha-glucosaminide N-acetyltransferase n=1 Tax=Candidatus Pseudothioglobus sp. Uisw_050_01 TaxID=3230997 RepID=UPI003A8C245F